MQGQVFNVSILRMYLVFVVELGEKGERYENGFKPQCFGLGVKNGQS